MVKEHVVCGMPSSRMARGGATMYREYKEPLSCMVAACLVDSVNQGAGRHAGMTSC